jgi:hypothetical protein
MRTRKQPGDTIDTVDQRMVTRFACSNVLFIHSFISSHYPRVQLPAASHYLLALLKLSIILPSLSPLSAYFLLSVLVRFLLL